MEAQQGSEGEEEKGFLPPSDRLFFRLAFKCQLRTSECLLSVDKVPGCNPHC